MKETGCCPRLKASEWHKKIHRWKKKPFYKTKYLSLFHIPLNYGSVVTQAVDHLDNTDLMETPAIMLAKEDGLFSSTLLISLKKTDNGLPVEKISGDFISLLFHGDYKDTGKWINKTLEYLKSIGKDTNDLFFWYVTCPGCAKEYGSAQTVIFAKIK
jgi:hypothetical protein